MIFEILMIAAKATLAILLTFGLASATRVRASLKHLLFSALFAFLLLLPFASRYVQAPKALDLSMTVPARNLWSGGLQPAEEHTNIRRAEARRSTGTIKPAVVLGTSYLAVSALLLASLAAGVWRLRRMAANGAVWLEGTAHMNELAAASGIRRAALVLLSNETAVPLTFGFRRSTILMPEAARTWSDGELKRALRHELEHVRREDWFAQLAARAACAIYWAHPLVWVAWRRFCFEAERACDDAVVVAFPGAEDYAGQLVSLAKSVRFSMVPALGMASPSRLSQRVRALLDPSQHRGPLGRFATAIVIAVTLIMLIAVAPARLIAEVTERVERHKQWSQVGEALAEAGEAGRMDIIKQFLDAGIDVNTVAEGDGTALIGACRGGHADLVRYLIDRGADVNLASDGDGNPLINAAREGQLEIVQILLDAGADINTVVPGDENPIINAARYGHEYVVNLLITRGADVNVRAYEGNEVRTALKMAKRGGYKDIIDRLIGAGARE
ncbi:MAG TPA: M56 family metallopeptidase [Thermoanaerobaculia bacterium]|nr:M56 family metallopeptidase [Thermoanaerobaculia bacterium]